MQIAVWRPMSDPRSHPPVRRPAPVVLSRFNSVWRSSLDA
jgi:hypothetical protein